MNNDQTKDLLNLLAHCGAAGILWLIAHGISMTAGTNRRIVRFVVMSGFACMWIFFLWPITGRGHREFLPLVFSIIPWWLAIVVGNLVERKKEKSQNNTRQAIAEAALPARERSAANNGKGAV